MEFNIKSWNEVPFSSYIEITQLYDKSIFQRNLEAVIILTDDDEWDYVSTKKITQVISENPWINLKPSINFKHKIGEWSCKPLTKLTLSEWIDLEKYILDGKYENIISLLYRKNKLDEWGNVTYEPYLYSCNERSSLFLDYPTTYLYGAIEAAIKYRDDVLTSFRELFDSMEEEEFEATEEEKMFMSEAEIIELKKQIKKDNEKKYYAWQKLLDDVSGGNWSTIPSILELPVIFVFNMLMMKRKFS